MSEKNEKKSGFREAMRGKIESADAPNDKSKGADGPPSKGVGAIPPAKSGFKTDLFPPSLTDLALYCRQLATLLDVGIPLVRSLNILSKRSKHSKLKNVSSEVAKDVEEGRRLSEALGRHPHVFSSLLVNVARIGEAGGILEPSLNRLADTMEQKVEIRKKIVSACMYPAIALLVAAGMLWLILTKAIPVFAAVYDGLPSADLPRPTVILIAISEFADRYWAIYIPFIIVCIVGFFIFDRFPTGRALFDYLRLKLPIIGGINTKINTARFTRSLGNLLSAGIPLLEGLDIVSRTSENTIVGNAIDKAHSNVERGGKMDEPLRKTNVFQPMVIDMISIGDEAGALDSMLLKIADIYDSDVDTTLKGLSSLIEPLLIVFLGGIVVFIALAVLLPYFSLASAVGAE